MRKLWFLGCMVTLCSAAGCSSGGDEGGGTGAATGGGAGGTTAAGGTGGTTAAGGTGGTTAAGGTGSTSTAGAGGTGVGGTDVANAGAGGTGTAGTGTAGTGAAGTGTAGTSATHEDLGEGDGMDVVMIGDSYMNFIFGQGTQFSLEAISGRNYREYAVPGTLMLNGQIPGQYTSAKNADADIKTVIMTGGGNDIITVPSVLSSCVTGTFGDACKAKVMEIQAAVTDLMTEMATDGVEDVIYVGYSYTQPPAQDLTELSDYSRAETKKTCLSDGSGPAGLRCHYVDPIELSTTDPPVPIGFDGIHPTKAGYDQIAGYVWDRMQAEGVRR